MNDPDRGATLTEYGIILGLVLLLAIGSLTLLGRGGAGRISATNETLASGDMRNYLQLNFAGSEDEAAGAGSNTLLPSRTMEIDPATGIVSIETTPNASPTNATSVENLTLLADSAAANATEMEKMVSTLSDPEVILWAKEVSDVTQYLAGATGSYSDIEALTPRPLPFYSKPDALWDTSLYQAELGKLLTKPPANGNPAEIGQVAAVGADAWTNAQFFVDKLNSYRNSESGQLDVEQLYQKETGCAAGLSCALTSMTSYELKSRPTYGEIIGSPDQVAVNISKAIAEGAISQPSESQSRLLRNASALNRRAYRSFKYNRDRNRTRSYRGDYR